MMMMMMMMKMQQQRLLSSTLHRFTTSIRSKIYGPSTAGIFRPGGRMVSSSSSSTMAAASLTTKEHPETQIVISSAAASSSSSYAIVTRILTMLTAAGSIFSIGFCFGRYTSSPLPSSDDDVPSKKQLVLPNGLPRTCCEHENDSNKDGTSHAASQVPTSLSNLTPLQSALPKKLKRIVGKDNVMDGMQYNTETTPYLKGSRIGMGPAFCIVTPRRLHHVVSVVEACVDANCIVIPQGQNTGLTGGSVPRSPEMGNGNHTTASAGADNNNNDNRPVVLISFKHLNAIFPIDDGQRVVCMAGVGLASVSNFCRRHGNVSVSRYLFIVVCNVTLMSQLFCVFP
jgi:D-lactate dehydrogenase (quinone)